ncbi:MAG: response regulator [Gammaproteobacteria bacterium]
MAISVLIVDDHEILRAGLRALLESQRVSVVGEADDGRSAIRLAKQLNPELVIMDIGMPEMNGVDATRRILAAAPRTKVLALSMHADRRFVTQMLDAGASGYLLKDCAVEELSFAIRTLSDGRIYLSPGIAGVVVENLVRRPIPLSPAPVDRVLSSREREVLQLIAEGGGTAEIADKLHLSVKTVESHRKKIMDKLGLHSVAQLTKYAIREGLTDIE